MLLSIVAESVKPQLFTIVHRIGSCNGQPLLLLHRALLRIRVHLVLEASLKEGAHTLQIPLKVEQCILVRSRDDLWKVNEPEALLRFICSDSCGIRTVAIPVAGIIIIGVVIVISGVVIVIPSA